MTSSNLEIARLLDPHQQHLSRNMKHTKSSCIDPATLEDVADRFPQKRDAAARLARLVKQAPPTVVVLGQFNTGKSSLLNVLLGEECFAASDKRGTLNVQVEKHDGLRWIDTPGLDADVAGEDVRKAIEISSNDADLRLLVHAVDLGDLDRKETVLIAGLERERKETGRAFLLVLTRLDKVPADDRNTIIEAIRKQAPRAKIIAVSAHAWARGRRECKPALEKLGNVATLKSEVEQSLAISSAAREAERIRLASDILETIEEERDRTQTRLGELRDSRQLLLDFMVPRIQAMLMKLKLELMDE